MIGAATFGVVVSHVVAVCGLADALLSTHSKITSLCHWWRSRFRKWRLQMVVFEDKASAKIKTEEAAKEAMRKLRHLNQYEADVLDDAEKRKKKLLEKVQPKLDDIDQEVKDELEVQVGEESFVLSEYRMRLMSELIRWGQSEFSGSTLKCDDGMLAVRDVPPRIDAPGTDDEERSKNRKDVVEDWWSKEPVAGDVVPELFKEIKGKLCRKANEFLEGLGLLPWFRLKLELNMSEIGSAFKAGRVDGNAAKLIGLELVPKGSSVTVKLAE